MNEKEFKDALIAIAYHEAYQFTPEELVDAMRKIALDVLETHTEEIQS